MLSLALGLLCTATLLPAADPPTNSNWRDRVEAALPLLGHRNWILVVDSAYPQQVAAGIEMVDTGAPQTEVLHYVLNAVSRAPHVRPDVFLDAELPFVPDQDAPGASAYRQDLSSILQGLPVQSLLHEKLLSTVNEAGQTFHVLILKTNMTVPYSSVFIRLNCRYWSDDAESRLRRRMSGSQN